MKRIGCFLLCIFLFLSTQNVYAKEVPEVVSEFVYIYNLDDGQVIYEKKAQEKLYPASMTKIMTALIVLENIQDIQTMVTITPQVLEGLAQQSASVAGFQAGEQVSVEDLLYGVMLPSGADATRALAYHISGSEEAFVNLMNAMATDLHLSNTHFVNTSGLHHDEHYSTAQDIAVILQEALRNETFKTIFSTNQYTTKPTNLHPLGLPLMSTKLKLMFGANLDTTILDMGMLSGGKTGFTIEGGLCLASTLEVNEASYIVITANAGQEPESAQHLKDTFKLGEYLGTVYTKESLFKNGDSVGTASVSLGNQNGVEAIVKEDVSIFKMKQEASNYEIDVKDVFAPVTQGQEIGTLKLILEGNIKKEIPLFAKESVEQNRVLIFAIAGGAICIIGCIITTVVIRRKRSKKENI